MHQRSVVRTSVDNLSAVKIGQPVQDALCHLAEHLLSGATSKLLDLLIDAV